MNGKEPVKPGHLEDLSCKGLKRDQLCAPILQPDFLLRSEQNPQSNAADIRHAFQIEQVPILQIGLSNIAEFAEVATLAGTDECGAICYDYFHAALN